MIWSFFWKLPLLTFFGTIWILWPTVGPLALTLRISLARASMFDFHLRCSFPINDFNISSLRRASVCVVPQIEFSQKKTAPTVFPHTSSCSRYFISDQWPECIFKRIIPNRNTNWITSSRKSRFVCKKTDFFHDYLLCHFELWLVYLK